MTSRNLTEVFVLMRNNAIQNRNMYDDRVSEIAHIEPYGKSVLYPISLELMWFLLFLPDFFFSILVTMKNYYGVHFVKLRKDLNLAMTMKHRHRGSISLKKPNILFPSKFD